MKASKGFLPSLAQAFVVSLLPSPGCAVSGASLSSNADIGGELDAAIPDAGWGLPPLDRDAEVTAPDATAPTESCIEATFPAVPTPLELLVLLDRSGSMLIGNRWEVAKSALLAFADTTTLEELYLSLFMFPMWEVADSECSARLYAYPLVPPRTTPEVALDFKDAFRIHVEQGRTPLRLAAEGALAYARNRQDKSYRQRALVLVTDGEGNACQSSTEDVARIVAEAREQAGILTFAVGMDGVVQDPITQIAVAGGTGAAIMISEGADATRELSAALQAVRAEASACSFQLPEPKTGRLDPSSVAIKIQQADGAEANWPLLDRKERCEGGTVGFYFDPASAPKHAILCPEACALARTVPAAQLELHAGCVWVLE